MSVCLFPGAFRIVYVIFFPFHFFLPEKDVGCIVSVYSKLLISGILQELNINESWLLNTSMSHTLKYFGSINITVSQFPLVP